jgi:hypothetical protein
VETIDATATYYLALNEGYPLFVLWLYESGADTRNISTPRRLNELVKQYNSDSLNQGKTINSIDPRVFVKWLNFAMRSQALSHGVSNYSFRKLCGRGGYLDTLKQEFWKGGIEVEI